jgi:hypothetical protein
LARWISTLSSPFLVSAVTVTLVVLLLHPPLPQLLLWAAIAVIFAAGIPFLFVLQLWHGGRISDLHVAIRSQRSRPFAAALVSGAVGVAVLYAVQAPAPLVALGVVYIAIGLTLAVISRYWKISMHTAVLAAGIIALMMVGYPGAIYALALVPLVLWARVYRRRHTLLQGLLPVLLAAAITPLVYEAALRLLAR